MFIDQAEHDFIEDELSLLHMIIGYPSMTFRRFKPLEPLEEGKPIPSAHQSMEQFEVPWAELEFRHRKDLVNAYLALNQDNLDYAEHFIPKYKNRATMASIVALTMLSVNVLLLIALVSNWR